MLQYFELTKNKCVRILVKILWGKGNCMFLFYDHNQNEKNVSFYKGKLFEKLLAEFLSKNGYNVSIRQKHNSLEYDLEGNDKTTGLKIIGEAKAYQSSISGEIISSFLGKLMGLGIIEKKVHGVFLSTSPLTPEANDYFGTVKHYGATSYSGEELFKKIIDTFEMPTKSQVFAKVKNLKFTPLIDYILTTNYGYSRVVIASVNTSLIPSHFFVFNNNIELISDIDLLNKYQLNISELAALEPVYNFQSELSKKEFRIIQQGLMLSKDWTDYRLPASPQFFVGRDDLVSQILKIISSDNNGPRVIQIKSRSGVGKSSTLALLSKRFEEKGYNVELHDARDIKSIVDIYSIIGRFIGNNTIPQNYTQIENQIVLKANQKEKSIFIVDQFESTFLQPEIFNAYETIAKIIYQANKNVFFCLARKNDQLTTYDDSLISLQQLNSISRNFELKDFSKEEAKELLDRINGQSIKKISRDVLAYVLEFAQGFPWLLKRTMAHILKLTIEDNISQKQLIGTGLMLDDLFEEELEGLEEIEKEYLTKICSKLPADFHQLQRHFDEDPLLPKMLDKLTQVRLLRLTGDTYDTYNDVFKEYLVYQKLPEFRHQHIYRQHPNSVINFFEKIINKNKFTLDQLSKSLKTSQKSLANLIKECRNLGLLKKEENYWVIPKNIKDIYLQGHLGAHIRRQLLNNYLVSSLIKTLSMHPISFDEFVSIVQKSFPYVEASDATWNLYANVLIGWLEVTKVVVRDQTQGIILADLLSSDCTESLGNLLNIAYGKRGRVTQREIFIPTASWKYFEECFTLIKSGNTNFNGECKKAYIDMKKCGILGKIDKITDVEMLKSLIISDYLQSNEYKQIWHAAESKGNIFNAVSKMIATQMTESTLVWRTKRIINWGKSLGLIKNKRYSYGTKN